MEKQPKRGELSTVPHGSSPRSHESEVKGSNPRGQRESWQGAQGATLATGICWNAGEIMTKSKSMVLRFQFFEPMNIYE